MISSVQPSVAQRERLEMLAEECAEVIQAVTKILRHGYNSFHPDHRSVSNRAQLERELLDLAAVRSMMLDAGDVEGFPPSDIVRRVEQKKRYTHAQ